MSHYCSTLIILCIDFRLPEDIYKYLKGKGLSKDYDSLTFVGGVKSLVSPPNPQVLDFILWEIGIPVEKHHIKQIILCNHTNCAAYESEEFNSFEEECAFHVEEMKKARAIISSKYPGPKINLLLGKILPSGEVELEEVNE